MFKAFRSYKTKYDASVAVDVPEKQPEKQSEKQSEKSSANVGKVSYGVQIMGLGRRLAAGDPAFKGLDTYSVKGESSNIYRYICGRYDSVEKAKASLLNITKKFPEAFVVEVKGTEVKRVK